MSEFGKQIDVAWEQVMEGFEDGLIMSGLVSNYSTDKTKMARNGDTIYRPMPYIGMSNSDGLDQTGNFGGATQRMVPVNMNKFATSPLVLDSMEMRDMAQEGRLADAAKDKLASDVNVQVANAIATLGTIIVPRVGDASGFDDVAQIDSTMNELGLLKRNRNLALSSRDYNNMASNLAARETMNSKVNNAYKEASVGRVSSFETFKLDYANQQTAAQGVGVTINGAGQYYTPVATVESVAGDKVNVDNRFQDVDITVTSGTVAVGDSFTVAGVESVNHITKLTTGQAKTHRIVGIKTGAGGTGTVTISPPFISNEGATEAEERYQNVNTTPANGAALTFLNTQDASINPFWIKDAIELLPGSLGIPTDAGAKVRKASLSNGLEVVMQEQYDIVTSTTKFRWDVFFGVGVLQPEMVGYQAFNQS